MNKEEGDMASTEEMISGYFKASVDAVAALFEKELYGHVLVLLFSTIDTMGLLDAPPQQVSASGESFKNWVKKYVLTDPSIEFNKVDLWGARCAVLHTFTSESDLSRKGQARQLYYYSGDKDAEHNRRFVAFAKSHEGGAHLAVHFGDICQSFFHAMKKFVYDLDANCINDQVYVERLRKVLQVHPNPHQNGTS